MMKHFASCVILGAMTAMALPASAQQIPPGQSCGGLLCDMGVFGHKVAVNSDGSPPTPAQVAVADKEVAAVEARDPHRLPCHDFLCRSFGGKTEEEMAAASQAAAPTPVAAAPDIEPAKPAKRAHKARRKQIAKAEPKTAEAEPAAK